MKSSGTDEHVTMADSTSVDQSLILIWHHPMNRSSQSFTSDLVSLDTNEQITMGDSVSFDQCHHNSSASYDRGYIWILHHQVRMGKSPLLQLNDLGFKRVGLGA
ncbi:hypothetical protein V6N13_025470 [Hibiscus sabdariffa]